MARRKTNDLENQMSLMDMMASKSPEYTEEGPEELLDPGEDMEDSEGQTDKPFKLVANKTTKAKASISTQALSVVKAVYADTVETNWEELFDGFDRLYAITFSSGIEFVNKVINKFSYAEVVFGCEKIIANDIAAIMSVQIDSVQRLAKSKSAGNLANRLDDGSLQLYVSRDTKSHEKIFILESADHKRVRVITGSANMSASAFCGIQRENIVCFDDEAAFSHYKVLFETFKETCSDNVSYKAVVNTMNQEDYLKENIKEVPFFQSIEKQKLVFLEQAQPEDEVEYEIAADVKKMQELVKPIMPKMPVQANRIVVAAEPMRVFGKRYTEVRRVAAEAVKQLPKLHIDYDAGTMTFNDENIDLNPNLSEVAKNIKSIQKFFSGMDYFYGDVEQAKKDYFKYMTWYLATPFMAYLRYFASRNNYDTKLFPMYGVIYGDSNGGKTTFIKFLVKLMCGETVKMNTTEDFTATRIDGLKRVCEGLPLNIDDLAKTQFQNHSERVIKNDEWGISDRLVNYPAVSITSNKITSLTKDLSKRAIICRIGAKIDNERGAKNSKRVNESMSELTTAFYGEYVRRMLVCIDEMTTEMRENANGKEYFPDIFHASSSVIADIFEACGIDLPDYVRILYYNDYMGDESIGRAAIEKIELAWQADPSKFRVDKKQNRLIYSYPPDGPWYELKYIADELPNSLEAEISGGNQLIMKDYGNGYSIEELAAKYRLSVRTCYRALDDAKQEARIQLAQVEDARKAEILAAYKNSVPLKEMIAKFNVAEGYCSMVANDAGLTENRRNERIKIRQKPRNENIFREYESGVPVQKLSEKYQLSVPGIYKVIQRVRRQKEAMSLAMDCEANQIERI